MIAGQEIALTTVEVTSETGEKTMEVGWYPVSLYEMKHERLWRDQDIRYLVGIGRLGTVCSNNPSLGKVIYFESPEDRRREYRTLACRGIW